MSFEAIPWESVSGRCFLSHSFADEEEVNAVAARLEQAGATTRIFALEEPNPDTPVSDRIIPAILECENLVYLRGGESEKSFWVRFEKDYALRSGLTVYAADPQMDALYAVQEKPVDLRIRTLYHRADDACTDRLFKWMREDRHFDIDVTRSRLRLGTVNSDLAVGLEEMLADGGVALYLCGPQSVSSIEHFYSDDFEDYLEGDPDFRRRFIDRRLEDYPHEMDFPDEPIAESDYLDTVDPFEYLIPVFVRISDSLAADTRPVGFRLLDLFADRDDGDFHWNRVDDLIISIYRALDAYEHRVWQDAP